MEYNMILNEITGVKRFYNLNFNQITKLLRRFGIEFIGGGKYGQVFSHKGWPYVVKIFKDDREYLAFIDYIAKHPNKHFPKVIKRPLLMHSFHARSPRENNKFWVVKIEKLYPITDKNLVKSIVYNLANGAEAYHRLYILNNKEIDEYGRRFYVIMPDGTRQRIGILGLLETYPEFKSLCGAYLQIMLNVEGSPDIHPNNIMQRKDQTIVLIDPVWKGSTPYQEYEEMLRIETDYYSQFEDEPQVSGPDYLQKQNKVANQIANDIAQNINDDSPF